jgi:hypothetical protein
VRRGDDDLGVDLLAPLEDDAGGASTVHQDSLDRRARADRRPECLRRISHRPRDAAHAAFGEAPGPHLAFADVADLVVRHHVRGSWRTRARPGADDSADRERAEHLA